ncbi:hypothetical protein B0H66DRAFT_189861 [Apodospora peruviana]|uniref:THUMP domain-containing protein n=1 Tax=Apodospora peruviana TaxID=516989 RepID=A0AAE0IBX2_9PEZI|nr:hypothetical protein B0H66DRAFT_189861 [Apodospora peruviana]
MTENGKRKDAPGGGASAEQQSKKKKTGNAGKWKTTHQQARMAVAQNAIPQPGDVGIWVTCARRQENKAAREVTLLFEQYAEKLYGIKCEEDDATSEDEEAEDIEAAIKKEVEALNSKKDPSESNSIFTVMKMNVDCLLFVKTKAPVEPIELVRSICLDARDIKEHGQMKLRYVNRFTPATIMGKATEQGLVEVAKKIVAPFFELSGKVVETSVSEPEAAPVEGAPEPDANASAAAAELVASHPSDEEKKGAKPFTYAIRPTIRNHSKLKRDFVINQIAGLINADRHKVNLSTPDKVVLVDLYQAVCSMTVVDGDWDQLKKYNMTEIYNQAIKNNTSSSAPPKAEGEDTRSTPLKRED